MGAFRLEQSNQFAMLRKPCRPFRAGVTTTKKKLLALRVLLTRFRVPGFAALVTLCVASLYPRLVVCCFSLASLYSSSGSRIPTRLCQHKNAAIRCGSSVIRVFVSTKWRRVRHVIAWATTHFLSSNNATCPVQLPVLFRSSRLPVCCIK